MKLVFDHKSHETSNIYTFWFKALDSPKHVAGQFIEMNLDHPDPDERGTKRWFTLSSSPTDKLVSITTRWFGDKASSFKQTLNTLSKGQGLVVVDPDGDFTLPHDPKQKLVFIAGGIGITPYHSIVKFLSGSGKKRDIQLIYAAKTKSDLAFLDLFKKYGCKIDTVIGQPLSGKKILELIGDYSDKLIYISGPEPMVESLFDQLKQTVPEKQLKGDYFPGYKTI